MNGQRSLMQIFRWPAILAVMTTVGLVSALLADGVWDALSWLMLLVPTAIGIARGWFFRN
jgi:hypothetical protein